MTPEQNRILDHLASIPYANATVNREDAHAILMATGGTLTAQGCLHDVVAKKLGAGVYRLSLKAARETGR